MNKICLGEKCKFILFCYIGHRDCVTYAETQIIGKQLGKVQNFLTVYGANMPTQWGWGSLIIACKLPTKRLTIGFGPIIMFLVSPLFNCQ